MNRKRLASQKDTRPDKGLKELEDLLNTFDGLHTIESSEGGEGEVAYVLLEADEDNQNRQPDKDLLALTQRLAKAMAMVIKTADNWLSPLYYADLSVEWTGEKDHSFICLSFSPYQIREITRVFHDVQTVFFRCNKGIPQ